MIAFSTESMIVLLIGCLVLDWFAFRSSAAEAGHGRKQNLQMAAVWITIITALTIIIGLLDS